MPAKDLLSRADLSPQDEPQAQKLLEQWPDMCKEHDIPCSGMHLSSGYTVGEEDGNRYVFNMNKYVIQVWRGNLIQQLLSPLQEEVSRFQSDGSHVPPSWYQDCAQHQAL
jgi:hypothetical protein